MTADSLPNSLPSFPDELKRLPRWVIYRLERKKGKITKVPYQANNGRAASTTDPSTWATFEEAVNSKRRKDGIGLVFNGDGIMGSDLDHCIDPDTGKIKPSAQWVLDKLDSYAEVSPSGTGIHVIFIGAIPEGGGKKSGWFECYSAGRFFTVTGRHLEGTPATVEDRHQAFNDVHLKIFGAPKHQAAATVFPDKSENQQTASRPPTGGNGAGVAVVTHQEPPPEEDDAALLTRARNARNGALFSKLYDIGDWQGANYPSQSEADPALLNLLAFWTNKNPCRMDRLFRDSKLYREKWDSKRGSRTYGAIEIEAACLRTTETYKASSPKTAVPASPAPPSAREYPREVPPASSRVPPPGATNPPPDLLGEMQNDYGNGNRIVAMYGADMRYCYPMKKWLMWDGRRWAEDPGGQAPKRAKLTMIEFMRQAVTANVEPSEKFARLSLNMRMVRPALEMAQSDICVLPEELDRDPDLLNCLNGTIDLRTGQLLPHDRTRFITKLVNYPYVPDAAAPLWVSFLYRIMGIEKDEDRADRLVKWLQKAMGYSVTGRTREKVVFVCHGAGDNGKTTLLDTLRAIVSEYATCIQIDSLMLRREETNNTQADIADLRGKRFAMTSEVEAGQRLAEGKLKRLSQGMGEVKAIRKYENPITFSETHKLWMDANHRPVVRGTDNAIWSRLNLIPFEVVIPEAERDRDLGRKLLEEGEGILAWVVAGAVRWYAEGLGKPPEVVAAARSWREDSDILKDFLEDCCELNEKLETKVSEVWKAYNAWVLGVSERKSMPQNELIDALVERGMTRTRDKKARKLRGIALKTEKTTEMGDR